MKVTVLVPSNEYKTSAGARIRYSRIISDLRRRGVELSLESVGQFDPAADLDCDVILISKCYDARSLVAAAIATEQGKLVGVDLYDDYFSDSSDSRLLRYRSWLSQVIEMCDFTLCSTGMIARVVNQYGADVPTHTLNDPSAEKDLDEVSSSIARKLDSARESLLIKAAWFGVGDNPYFPVGLTDLAGYADALGELSSGGFDVELTILTNSRALTAEGLSQIAKLPVAADVREWTQGAESALLREALVSFLPVNAQGFSVAKSLNRAVTALSNGCQVLSAGYPLYAALEPLIYRDPGQLVTDVARGSLRFSAETMSLYRGMIASFASAECEAKRLAEFLGRLKPRVHPRPLPLMVVHGHSTRIETHAIIRKLDGLSVASPYCSAALDFDVVFRGSSKRLQMLVSRKAASRLRLRARQQSQPLGDHLCVLQDGDDIQAVQRAGDWSKEPLPFQLVTYSSTMQQIRARLADAFGPGRTIFSEVSPLPFSLATQAPIIP